MTRAEKYVLDLLSAWPLCTREQLAGLMGGVTLRRVNQVLRSLTGRQGLVRDPTSSLHMLTDEGLTYLARRDRAAVGTDPGPVERRALCTSNADIYAGTAVRALCLPTPGTTPASSASPPPCPPRSPDLRTTTCWTCCPRHRSSIGYRWDWTTYVIHPDASFTLEYKGRWRPYLLEFERRATTPKRMPAPA